MKYVIIRSGQTNLPEVHYVDVKGGWSSTEDVLKLWMKRVESVDDITNIHMTNNTAHYRASATGIVITCSKVPTDSDE